jgi:hypothetical protein
LFSSIGSAQVRANAIVQIDASASSSGAPMTAVALNLTASQSRRAGSVTVWPCGTARPALPNLHFGARATVSNLAITAVGTGANLNRVCLLASADAHITVDATSWAPVDGGFVPMTPARVVDTRRTRALAAGSSTSFPLGQFIPSGTPAASLNLTVVSPSRAGWLSVFACGTPDRPRTLQFSARQSTSVGLLANLVGNNVCVYTSTATHIWLDINGYTAGSGSPPPAPAPGTTTTTVAPAVPTPAAFAKSSPRRSQSGVSNTRVTLTWTAAQRATAYEVCFTTASTCTSWTNVGTQRSVTMRSLQRRTTYTWQVRAVNNGGATPANSGEAWTFTTR